MSQFSISGTVSLGRLMQLQYHANKHDCTTNRNFEGDNDINVPNPYFGDLSPVYCH